MAETTATPTTTMNTTMNAATTTATTTTTNATTTTAPTATTTADTTDITDTTNTRGHAPLPRTMRAVVQRAYGPAADLEVATVDLPTIDADEVLVEVHAAGLDRGVEHLMTGLPYLIRVAGYGLTRPRQPIIGLDVAGRVVAVGPDVTRFTPGDRVFGIASGSFAEYATADEDKLSHVPDGISFEAAAVAAVSGITALQALTDVGGLAAGQRVLVIGASGGVGSYAVQLARALGADVTGVASTSKVDLVRLLGADHVVDYTTDDYLDGAERYDLIVDIGGRNRVSHLRRALTATGTLVIVGGEGGGRWTGGIGRQLGATLLSPFVKQRLKVFISTEHRTFIDRLAEFLASGAVTPAIGTRCALDEAPGAVAELTAGTTSGKSVIVVRDEPQVGM